MNKSDRGVVETEKKKVGYAKEDFFSRTIISKRSYAAEQKLIQMKHVPAFFFLQNEMHLKLQLHDQE